MARNENEAIKIADTHFLSPLFIPLFALLVHHVLSPIAYDHANKSAADNNDIFCNAGTKFLFVYIKQQRHKGFGPKWPYKPAPNGRQLFLLLILLLSGDIESNPGPRQVKFPCGVCEKAVKWKQRAIACENCSKWYHVECMQMSTNTYEVLANTSLEWICCQCGLANFSSSIFSETISKFANFYDILSPNVPSPKIHELPMLESTPKSEKPSNNPLVTKVKGHRNKSGKKKLKSNQKEYQNLVTNFQNIVNKKEALLTMIDSSDPDIIVGTETWLNSSIINNEIFPPNI